MPEDNPFKIVLEYDMWSAYRIKKYKKWFKKHLDKGDKIPAYVIKRFLAIFKSEEELEKVKKGLVDKITADTMHRFDKYNYDFKFEKPAPPKGINFGND